MRSCAETRHLRPHICWRRNRSTSLNSRDNTNHLDIHNLASVWRHQETDKWRLSYLLTLCRRCSRTCAKRTSWVVLVNTYGRSHAEAVERGLLVAYPVIDIREWTLDFNASSLLSHILVTLWLVGRNRSTISYALFESAVRLDIHPKSSIYHEVEPSWIWMTECVQQTEPHFQTGRNEFITY